MTRQHSTRAEWDDDDRDPSGRSDLAAVADAALACDVRRGARDAETLEYQDPVRAAMDRADIATLAVERMRDEFDRATLQEIRREWAPQEDARAIRDAGTWRR